MKFRGHETFSIRKGWLSKGLRCVVKNPSVFVAKDENAMDVLGIGSNMVKSLRYWLQATMLTSEPNSGQRDQLLTALGKLINEYDPFFEEIGTLWLIHHSLSTNKEMATSWYLFFNKFDSVEFDEDDFCGFVRKYATIFDSEKVPSDRTIGDDYKCIINTYYSKNQMSSIKDNPEDNFECPLSELGLISFVKSNSIGNRVYRKQTPNIESIPIEIALAMILYFANGKDEILISSLVKDENSISKICNLDTANLLLVLYSLEQSRYINVIRTAGLDVIRITTNMTYEDCIKAYYNKIN